MNNVLTTYHVTTKEVWEQHIQHKGLTPQIGERSAEYGEEIPRIYLFSSYDAYEDAMLQWMGELYDEEEELVLLKVNLPLLEFEDFMQREADYEIAVTKSISKEHLSFLEEA